MQPAALHHGALHAPGRTPAARPSSTSLNSSRASTSLHSSRVVSNTRVSDLIIAAGLYKLCIQLKPIA
jgi:hypothetical protein